MTPARFMETRGPIWDKLDDLIKRTQRRGVKALTESELEELTRIYPAVAVDVARARRYQLDDRIQRRINHLAIRAHGLLYRKKSRRSTLALWSFFRHDYPVLFRRLWPYVLLSCLIFFIAGGGAYTSVRLKPSTAYVFVPGEIDLVDLRPGVSAKDISERFRQIPNAPLAAGVMTNNITVAFNAFALGISAGIGTIYVVLINAMMLGGFTAHFDNHHLSYPFWSFIAPHGVIEIFAILVAAAAGLRLGLSFALPGRRTRKGSLKQGAAEAVQLVLGTVPMFIIAGIIEGFVTPSTMPGWSKIILGVVVWAVVFVYLMRVGYRKNMPKTA